MIMRGVGLGQVVAISTTKMNLSVTTFSSGLLNGWLVKCLREAYVGMQC